MSISAEQSSSVGARLALIGLCGDMVVALEAHLVHQIRRAADTPTVVDSNGNTFVDVDGDRIPAWSMGTLLEIPAAATAWVLVDVAAYGRRVAFGLSKCLAVQPLPTTHSIPEGVFQRRRGAIVAGFLCSAIPDLSGYATGIVVNAAALLGPQERSALKPMNKGQS